MQVSISETYRRMQSHPSKQKWDNPNDTSGQQRFSLNDQSHRVSAEEHMGLPGSVSVSHYRKPSLTQNYPSEWQWYLWDDTEPLSWAAVEHLGRCKVSSVNGSRITGMANSHLTEVKWNIWYEADPWLWALGRHQGQCKATPESKSGTPETTQSLWWFTVKQ